MAASSSSSSSPLGTRPSGGSKPGMTRASGGGLGLGLAVVAMARGAAAVKREPKPEPWAAEPESGPAVVLPRPVEGPPMPAPFVAKTYEMVADAATDAVVSWAPGGAGNSFVVWDPQALAVGILPRFFKHANFASFIRQLNIYVRISPSHPHAGSHALPALGDPFVRFAWCMIQVVVDATGFIYYYLVCFVSLREPFLAIRRPQFFTPLPVVVWSMLVIVICVGEGNR
jgi:hypothetical protein